MRIWKNLALIVSIGLLLAACGGSGSGGGGGTDDGGMDDGGLQIPGPTVTGVTPPATSNFGGTTITISGADFLSGTISVTVGGVAPTNVTIVDDATITCVTPAGAAGSQPVEVSNEGGADMVAFSLFEPILVADGGGNPAPPAWDLWAFDPLTDVWHVVGPIGFGVTCMDFEPGTGTLYGATAPGNAGARQLITIDPVTGAGTAVGTLLEGGATNHVVQGMTFVGATLYGNSGGAGSIVTINTATAAVTVAFINGVTAPGGGLASDVANSNPFYMVGDTAPLVQANIGTMTMVPVVMLNGFSFPGVLKSATFHQGTLYAMDAENSVQGMPSAQQIVTVDTVMGQLAPAGSAPPSMFASAIASRTR